MANQVNVGMFPISVTQGGRTAAVCAVLELIRAKALGGDSTPLASELASLSENAERILKALEAPTSERS